MLKRHYASLLASLSILHFVLHADAGEAPTTTPNREKVHLNWRPGKRLEKQQVPVGYLYPADCKLEDWVDVFASADFLYWNYNKDISDVGRRVRSTATVSNSSILTHDVGYKPAFQVEAGMTLTKFDNFVISAAFLYYRQTTTNSYKAHPGETITPLIGATPGATPPPATRERSHWTSSYDFYQITAGRPFYFGTRLILRPGYGLKGCWSHEKQALKFDMVAGGVGKQSTKAKWWGIGPYLGLDLKGLVLREFYIVGKAAITLAYMRQTQSTTARNFPAVIVNTSKLGHTTLFLIQPWLESGIGLGWGHYGTNEKWHMDLAVSYDYFATWNTNDSTPQSLLSRDFYMHGLTCKAQLNF